MLVQLTQSMKRLPALLFLFVCTQSLCQSGSDTNYLCWSSSRRLTVNDFVIKTGNMQTTPCFGQFYIDYQVAGFDFMTKNFNKKVHNYFIRSASWIDTTYDINVSIRYQQTLFDLAEVYARRFRKDLKDNRKKILTGTDFTRELNTKAMTEFAKRRVEYDADTKFGTNTIAQQNWEAQIQSELLQLKDFSAE